MHILSSSLHILHLWLVTSGVFINQNLPVDDFHQPGDFLLAMFAPLSFNSQEKCKGEFYPATVQVGQAAKWVVDRINRDPEVLPGVTLGIVLLNDCDDGSVALSRATQLIPLANCATGCQCLDWTWNKTAQSYFGNYMNQTSPHCQMLPKGPPVETLPSYANVIGVIGPLTSGRSVLTASLLASYEIAQISYKATSDQLSDKAAFPYFSRVIPPDRYIAKAMVDIMVKFNWTYISTVNIADSYGRDGIKHVVTNTKKQGICIAYSGEIYVGAVDSDYDYIVDNIEKNSNARVVVLFMHPSYLNRIYKALNRKGHVGKFILLAPESFDSLAYTGIEPLCIGTFAIKPKYGVVQEFQEYFETLPIWRNESGNPWQGSYTPETAECTWKDPINNTKNMTHCSVFSRVTEIPDFYWSEPALGAMDSVLTFAYALDDHLKANCSNLLYTDEVGSHNKTLSNDLVNEALMKCFSRAEYLKSIRKSDFEGFSQHIIFDSSGDLLGGYDISYFNKRGSGYVNSIVGTWSRLTNIANVNESDIEWYVVNCRNNSQTDDLTSVVPESVCAKPCNPGQIYLQGELACCWQCHHCRDNEIVSSDQRSCLTCPPLTWPEQSNFTSCEIIKPTYMTWTDSLAIGLETLSGLGLLIILLISKIFISNQDKKVVRGSNRELMAPITIGVFLAFLTVFTFLAKPKDWTCYCNYFGFHLSCTLIFGPLFIKTLRMYRIFTAAERCEARVSMVDAKSQVAMTVVLFVIQAGISVGTAVVHLPNATTQMPVLSVRYVELLCQLPLQNLIIPLSFNLLLLLLCAIFGFLTRKLPDNFNESWYIFISVATTLFIWIAFLPTYIMAFYAYHKAALLSFVLILNSAVTIACLYLPKIYALYFVDESKIKTTNFESSSFSNESEVSKRNTVMETEQNKF